MNYGDCHYYSLIHAVISTSTQDPRRNSIRVESIADLTVTFALDRSILKRSKFSWQLRIREFIGSFLSSKKLGEPRSSAMNFQCRPCSTCRLVNMMPKWSSKWSIVFVCYSSTIIFSCKRNWLSVCGLHLSTDIEGKGRAGEGSREREGSMGSI